MIYTLLYHPLVVSEDIPQINKNLKSRIAQAIKDRLSTHPESYGKPLRGSLAGYWKLRIGDYRVVFRIVRAEIWILAVRHRKDIYADVIKRLSWKA